MPDHAGFAVAIVIRDRVLNDSTLLAYSAGRTARFLRAPIPDGPPPVVIDFFLTPPRMVTRSADPDHFSVRMRGWGPLTIEWDGIPRTRDIRWEMGLRVRSRFVVLGTSMVLQPQDDDVAVQTWMFAELAGGPFPEDVGTYLRSGLFKNRLRAAVVQAIRAGLLAFPPIDLSFLGPIVQVADMETGSRVADGAILVGLDVEAADVSTSGDPDLLVDFARTNDVATLVNPDAAPVMIQAAMQQIRNAVAQQGATLERLDLSVREGAFRIGGRASDTGGSVSFSFSVLPQLFDSRPGAYLPFPDETMVVRYRTWPALTFRTAEVDVDVDRSTWVVVVEVVGALLTGAVIPLFIEDLVRQVSAQVAFGIENAPVGTPVPRVRRVPPDEPGQPVVRVEITEFEIHANGIFTGIEIEPLLTPPALLGLTSIPRDVASDELEYRVELPLDVAEDDPKLRIRWTVLDLASGSFLINDDAAAFGRLRFSFRPSSLGPIKDRYGVNCRVYRTLGPDVEDILNEGITLDVHPPNPPGTYVRWRYDVKNPQIRFDRNANAWTYASPSETVVRRWSAVHRLDHPCRNAEARSRYTYTVENLDRLPFPLKQILDRRDTVCEYCFFGGPGKRLPSL